MKTVFKIAIFLVFFLNFGKLYSETKVAYIDLDFVLNNSNIGKELSENLEKKLLQNNKKNEKIEEELKEEEKKIVTQKNILKKDEYEKKVNDLKIKVLSYRKQKTESSKKFNEERAKITGKMMLKINPILAEYSQKNSISIILQKKNIIIGKSEFDITKDILKIFNDTVKSIN